MCSPPWPPATSRAIVAPKRPAPVYRGGSRIDTVDPSTAVGRSIVALLLAAGVLTGACAGPEPPGAGTGTQDGSGIEALSIDGVWVFRHDPAAGMDALHGGRAEIVEGCLVVDEAIVVWHADRFHEAAAAIAAIRSGENPEVLIPGGGISLKEGTSPEELPTVITDRCPASTVWFGAP